MTRISHVVFDVYLQGCCLVASFDRNLHMNNLLTYLSLSYTLQVHFYSSTGPTYYSTTSSPCFSVLSFSVLSVYF